MRHTRYLRDADDIMTWANPGPGCIRGIVRLLGGSVRNRADYPSHKQLLPIMRGILRFSNDFLADWMPAWEMRDVEHTLCEFDKYERVRLGEGKPRQKYHPPTDPRQLSLM